MKVNERRIKENLANGKNYLMVDVAILMRLKVATIG